MNIGVFDSGLGGLTIFKSLLENLPEYNYIYLGDNARVPYGNRSQEIIYQFTKEAIDFLFKQNCQLIILACNTATSTSLHKIQQEYLPKFYPDRRVLGVIKPVTEKITDRNFKKIGVIGTKATINSGAFTREIKKTLPDALILQQSCPLLVPYIEDSGRNDKVLQLILKEYLAGLKKENIDSLVLACTHYEIIKKEIQREIGPQVEVISEGKIVADKLRSYLTKHLDIEKKLEKKKQRTYFVTDLSQDFKKLMRLFLGSHANEASIKQIKIDNG
ncbi:glutamate racemase [Candidatus Roizmanbacteria bacterium]|nr:glutamate racemase [Candidatus Roizmanbacteria bacterium]